MEIKQETLRDWQWASAQWARVYGEVPQAAIGQLDWPLPRLREIKRKYGTVLVWQTSADKMGNCWRWT